MGAGKTTTSKALARELRRKRIDTDSVVAAKFGSPIETIFAQEGETRFRQIEEQNVLEVLANAGSDSVVSLGGGSLNSEAVRDALADHFVVQLDVEREVSWSRVKRSKRPLAKDYERFCALYDERQSVYERAADLISPQFDRRKIGQFAEFVSQQLPAKYAGRPADAKLLWAPTPDGGYPVWVQPNLLQEAVEWPLPASSRRFAITDENVADLYAGRIKDLSGLVEMQAGEEFKTLATCERVWGALVEQQVTRTDHIVAIGGGVVGDLAGFVASTYQRGIPVVQVPTTLVSQVDSAFGGKTGVDLPTAKNYVGAYHQPSAVLVDPEVLKTLPAEEFAAGYAEVIKTALIAGGELWRQVADGEHVSPKMIMRCARTKLTIVAGDERDSGRRQLLNLGHTVGHAIETVSGYSRYRHGEAVALGLLAALELSNLPELRQQVSDLCQRAGLPIKLDPKIAVDDVVAATARDKKRVGSKPVPFVLLREPGDARFGQEVATERILQAVQNLY